MKVRTTAIRMLPTVLDNAVASLGPMGWTLFVSWFTDMDIPDAQALGLEIGDNPCDRIEHRFRVTDESEVQSWREFSRDAPAPLKAAVDMIPGASPAAWLVSRAHQVPVRYDVISEDERAEIGRRELLKQTGGQLWTPG